ncbi:MAG: 50S ribosomal protein L2 [bacterium]|nr:50S ribosomal protein L2 [bacterium]
MGVKTFKPVTQTLRYKTVNDFKELTTDEPYKALTTGKRKQGGRNSEGRITCRHKGGGHRKLFRIIDFRRDKKNVEGRVLTIEYDPNRTSYISLILYKDGERRYILAPHDLKKGDMIVSGENVPIKVGNCLPLKGIPLQVDIHNIELKASKGGQIVRSAGSSAQIVAKEGDYYQVKLPSGEIRLVNKECYATIGRVSNIENENIVIGKAGRSRWKGIRPTVRGMTMNPVDHPHGGGEGRSKGYKQPQTPWAMPTKGYKTRHKRNRSDRFIIKRRDK